MPPLALSLSIDASRFLTVLRSLAQRAPHRVRDAFEEIASQELITVRDRLGQSHHRLANSVQIARRDLASLSNPAIRIGSALPWARITQEGGVIQTFERRGLAPTPDAIRRRVFGAKPIKYLTIPIKSAGVPEYARARDYQQLFPWKSKKTGKLFLAQRLVSGSGRKDQKKVRGFADRGSRRIKKATKTQKKAGLRVLFLLVDKITIHPHPYLYWGYNDIRFATQVLIRHFKESTTENIP
jgi:hypothetical protein